MTTGQDDRWLVVGRAPGLFMVIDTQHPGVFVHGELLLVILRVRDRLVANLGEGELLTYR